MKNSILLMICLMVLSCTDNRNPQITEAKVSVMSSSDFEDYMALTNNLDKKDNYFELMPYSLKMQKYGLGYHEFYKTYLRVVFENKFDSKNIMKLEKFERDYLIQILQKGALADDTQCKEQLIEYYKNGWGVSKNLKKADSIYATFGYPDTYKPNKQ